MDLPSLETVALLRCPLGKLSLRYATAGELEQINERIAAETAIDRGRQQVTRPLEAGLIDESGSYVYPIRDRIVILTEERAIPCQQGNLEQ